MSSSYFGLTTNESIRAQLGAGVMELGDDKLANLNLQDELELDLLDWFPDYTALMADESGDTVVAKQQLALKIYAKTFCAYACIPTARMGFLQKRVDGEHQGVRFQNKDSMNELTSQLLAKLNETKAGILAQTSAYTPVASVAEYTVLGMAVSNPSADKITEGNT